MAVLFKLNRRAARAGKGVPPIGPPSKNRLFLFFLGGRGGDLFAHGAGLAAGGALLGFAAGFDVAAAFFTFKDGHEVPPMDRTIQGSRFMVASQRPGATFKD